MKHQLSTVNHINVSAKKDNYFTLRVTFQNSLTILNISI